MYVCIIMYVLLTIIHSHRGLRAFGIWLQGRILYLIGMERWKRLVKSRVVARKLNVQSNQSTFTFQKEKEKSKHVGQRRPEREIDRNLLFIHQSY